MATHTLLVLSNAVEGQDDTFNDWYTNTHIGDVLKVPGIVRAQRFRLASQQLATPPYRYLALYDIETDNLGDVLGELGRRLGTEAMVMSPAFDANMIGAVFEPITPKVEAKR